MDTTPYIPQDEKRFHILNLDTTNPNVTSAPYDVWCNHVVYDNLLTDEVVPSSQHFVVSNCPGRSDTNSVRLSVLWMLSFAILERGYVQQFRLVPTSKTTLYQKQGHCRVDQSSYQIVGTGLHANKSFAENFEAVLNQARRGNFLLLVTERMVESMLVLWHVYRLHPLDVAFLSKKVDKTTLVSFPNKTPPTRLLLQKH